MKTKNYRIPRHIIKEFKHKRIANKILCKAPFVSMSIGLDGRVSPCCYTQINDKLTGDAFFPIQSLSEIWNGDMFSTYRKMINKNALPNSCNICRDKLFLKEFDTVKINEYNYLEIQKKYPSLIEISVDNTCNLECVMCSSVNSSKIAMSRGVKSINKIDTDLLFTQLKEFLPFVREIIFTGGEPFLSRFYFNVWKEIIKKNPSCKITLNTNCSVLTDEAKEIIEKGIFEFNVSLDSISKETYEHIRKNANFETTFNNFNYLVDYSIRKNVPISVPVCPLILNYKEIPDIIKFCNRYNAYIVFVHVFSAYNVALSAADEELLLDALAIYKQIVLPNKSNAEKQNALQFSGLISDVAEWRVKALQRKKYVVSISTHINNCEFNTKFYNLKSSFDVDIASNLDEVFNLLPDYYRTPEFISALSKYSTTTIANYLKEIPNIELAEYFQMIFNQFVDQEY